MDFSYAKHSYRHYDPLFHTTLAYYIGEKDKCHRGKRGEITLQNDSPERVSALILKEDARSRQTARVRDINRNFRELATSSRMPSARGDAFIIAISLREEEFDYRVAPINDRLTSRFRR